MTQDNSSTKNRDRRTFMALFETSVIQKKPDFEFSQLEHGTFDLSYVCLLIPRFSNHILSGDIVVYLESWLKNICISYAWRLDYIDIKPDYLHWIVRVPMSVAPARLIKITRTTLSSQIFEEFPRYKKENHSSDFWAAPSMLLAGRLPHPDHMIREFIQITRSSQGYLPLNKRD